ncbi:MAG TPA: hypothetical protein VHA13_05125, partial [Gammaproteobacteria bacterium]|nr:hypothetical protein [Gammaproteobacteria bacterium]
LGARGLMWLVFSPIVYASTIWSFLEKREKGLSFGIIPMIGSIIGGLGLYAYQILSAPFRLLKYFTADTIRNRAQQSEHHQHAKPLGKLKIEIEKDFQHAKTKSTLESNQKKPAEKAKTRSRTSSIFFTAQKFKVSHDKEEGKKVRFAPGTKD